MSRVDPKEPSMKTVAYTKSDVQIVVLLTPDKLTAVKNIIQRATLAFKNNNYNSAFTQYVI